MPLSLQCPNPACGKVSTASADIQGRRVRCKHCKQSFVAVAPTMEGASSDTRSSGPPSRPAALPAEIGRFQVRAKLGAGAFGTVYRAYDPQLDREVALKVPNAGVVDNPRRVERFLREAKAAANLRHPHIVPVFDAGKDGDLYYIASAFIAGKKLSDTIGENGVEFERAARLARELAEALAYAHEQGVIHRDVKPDNILVDEHDRVHLMDFGLAARLDEEARLTTDGSVLGTPAYMAPEQAAGQQGEVQPAADQYSAGIVLYELLCGRTPFRGPPAVVIHNQVHTEPDRPTTIRKDTPKDLETICLKAIQKRPSDRYAGCGALADDLRRWSEAEPISARRQGPAERAVRWGRRNPVLFGLALAVFLLLTTGVLTTSMYAVKAKRAAAQATRSAEEANQNAQAAEENSRQASRERAKALQHQSEAVVSARKARHELYFADMRLAGRAFEEDNIALLNELLSAHEPKSDGETDQRQFEWYYLHRRSREWHRTFDGHTDEVNCVAFSPDGKQIASCSQDGTVRLWDRDAGKCILQIKSDSGNGIDCVAFSPDGKRVVSGGPGTVNVWDTQTGARIRSFATAEWSHRAVAFSSDGQKIFAGAIGGTWVWDATTGAQIARGDADLHWKGLRGGWVTNDAGLAAMDGPKLQLTNMFSKVTLPALNDRPPFDDIAISSDSAHIAVLRQNRLFVVDSTTGQITTEANGHGRLGDEACLSFTPDSKRIVTGEDMVLRVWDSESLTHPTTLRGHNDTVRHLNISQDGKWIVSAGADRTVRLWQLTDHLDQGLLGDDSEFEEDSLAFAPDGNQIMVVRRADYEHPGRIVSWDLTSVGRTPTIGDSDISPGLGLKCDGTRVVCADGSFVRMWDCRTSKLVRSAKYPNGDWYSCHSPISPDGTVMVTVASDNAEVSIWDSETGRKIRTLVSHPPDATDEVKGFGASTAFSADARYFVCAGPGFARLWRCDTWQEMLKLNWNDEVRVEPSFIGMGAQIALQHGSVTSIHSTATGEVLHAVDLKSLRNSVLGFSPDGRRMVVKVGNEDTSVRVWDVASGKELLSLRGHEEPVSRVVFSPDGKRIASLDRFGELRLWRSD